MPFYCTNQLTVEPNTAFDNNEDHDGNVVLLGSDFVFAYKYSLRSECPLYQSPGNRNRNPKPGSPEGHRVDLITETFDICMVLEVNLLQ